MEGTTAPNRASFWAEQASALKPGQEADMGTTNNNPEAKGPESSGSITKKETLPSFRTAWGHLWREVLALPQAHRCASRLAQTLPVPGQ